MRCDEELAYSCVETYCNLNVKLNNSDSRINIFEVQLIELIRGSKIVYETSDNNCEKMLYDTELYVSLENNNKAAGVLTAHRTSHTSLPPHS